MNKRKLLGIVILLAAGVALAGAFLSLQQRPVPGVQDLSIPYRQEDPDAFFRVDPKSFPLRPSPQASGDGDQPQDPALEVDNLPHDKLFITVERQGYQDGQLRLIIPKLDVDIPVLNGTAAATLLRGVGLYEYAQLPGLGNRNVSIAGHRNGVRNGVINDNMPFYYVDTLEEGDCLYLRDSQFIYQYLWHDQEVVTPDNWGPIYSQGYSCLTLTTCTPIGIADHRLIVRGELFEIIQRTDSYEYPQRIDILQVVPDR